MSSSHILRFQQLARRKPTPAKASLRARVRRSVSRSIRKLPALGEQNPEAALLIERTIDCSMPAPPTKSRKPHPTPTGPRPVPMARRQPGRFEHKNFIRVEPDAETLALVQRVFGEKQLA